MKKLLLGAFLLVSVLSFSAERTLSFEDTFQDEKTGIVYAINEKIPFTGIVELRENGNIKFLVSYKNGLMDGKSLKYYKSGQINLEETYKKGLPDGISKAYYENGKVEYEASYKNGKKDGCRG